MNLEIEKLGNTINQIASNISFTLPLLPPKIETSKIKTKSKLSMNGEKLTENEMCDIILKYVECDDFHTLPLPLFFYKKYPQYYNCKTKLMSLTEYLNFLNEGDEYKKCKDKEERRIFMRNQLVKSMCEFYKSYGFLPSYDLEFTKNTDYVLFNRDAYTQLQLEKEGQEEPQLDLEN